MTNKTNVNQKYSNLTVIAILPDFYTEPSGKIRKKALVKCDCGFEFEIKTNLLFTSGQKCSKCKFNTNCIVKIGETYDKLTVIGFELVNNKKEATCQCSCGNIVTRRPELLKHINVTNNCGCDHRGSWKGFGELSQTFMYRIKRNAKIRNMSFDISIEYLWNLYQSQNGLCALSKLPISFSKLTADASTASLDRIDSDIGYTKENIQWVHKDVNKMKMEFPESRFIEVCKLIALNK